MGSGPLSLWESCAAEPEACIGYGWHAAGRADIPGTAARQRAASHASFASCHFPWPQKTGSSGLDENAKGKGGVREQRGRPGFCLCTTRMSPP